jgi:serine/threonine protein kinase
MKQCEYTSISTILEKEFNFTEINSKNIESFLKLLLDYCPKKRGSATQCLQHEWLSINSSEVKS